MLPAKPVTPQRQDLFASIRQASSAWKSRQPRRRARLWLERQMGTVRTTINSRKQQQNYVLGQTVLMQDCTFLEGWGFLIHHAVSGTRGV